MRHVDRFLIGVFFFSCIALGAILIQMKLLPFHYAILLFVLLFVLCSLFSYGSLITASTLFHRIRRCAQILASVGLCAISLILLQFDHTISHITQIDDTSTHIRLIALIENDDEIASYHNQIVGIYTSDYDAQQLFMDYVRSEYKVHLSPTQFASAQDGYEALKQKKIAALIVTANTYEILDDSYHLKNKVRLVYEYVIDKPKETNLLETPFHVLITGIDQIGSSKKHARSDANVIASVNLQTKSILLTSIPRDSFIPNVCLKQVPDKLTHISLQGDMCTIQSLESLLGISISNHIKVSFTSVIELIDAIGGLEVQVPMTFCEYDETKKGVIHIKQGKQVLNGKQTLALARHRYTLYDGDIGRTKNQQLILNALLRKTTSPKLLGNMENILSLATKTVTTTLTQNQLYSLIRFQLEDTRPYIIQNQTLTGSFDTKITASMPYQAVSVVLLSNTTILDASNRMKEVSNGIDLSKFKYSTRQLTIKKDVGETTGAKGTNRCHIP